jgi:hypothetical protein
VGGVEEPPAAGVHQAVVFLDDLHAVVAPAYGHQAIVVSVHPNVFGSNDVVEHDPRDGKRAETNPNPRSKCTAGTQMARGRQVGNDLLQHLAQEDLIRNRCLALLPFRSRIRAPEGGDEQQKEKQKKEGSTHRATLPELESA